MAFDRFMIAPINSGQQTDQKPFLIPDDAFEELTNAFIFRGRVRKRFGSRLMNGTPSSTVSQLYSRLRIKVGTTAAVTGNLGATIMPGATWKIGQMFSVGTTIFTAYQANGATYTTGLATATYNTATGSLVITGNTENTSTDVYFYPSTPVMGIVTYNALAVNDEPVIAFDTQFAYQYTGTAWARAGTAVWTGTDSQFFWATNWRGVETQDFILFVTNFNATDKIKYWNATTWTDLNPVLNAGGTTLESARMIVAWKDRLICLNTLEKTGVTTSQFVNRARWCQNGTPLTSADIKAWREDVTGKGMFLDAAVKEQIISCAFIKDRLIVYFEKSTWELVSTGNNVMPFFWQRINQELGVESTFSAIPFDKVVVGMGQVGVHACNGANVDRIDQKIPYEVFNISNLSNGPERVYGIRDYYNQMAYWTYPSPLNKYPDRVLVFNYLNGSWAIFTDSITCFGYYQPVTNYTWANSSQTWEQSVQSWNAGSDNAKFRSILAGNSEGFVFIVDSDATFNAPALQITNIAATTPAGWVQLDIIDHTLGNSDYIQITNANGTTGLNNKIYEVYFVNDNAIAIQEPSFSGTYKGGGTVTRISNIDIKTKQYNFYVEDGRNAFISKVDFLVDKTGDGQITVDYSVGSSNQSQITVGNTSNSILGTSVLETSAYTLAPIEKTQDRVWHPIYLQGDGECIQLKLYMSDAQIRVPAIAFSKFELNAMTFYATPTASRMQ